MGPALKAGGPMGNSIMNKAETDPWWGPWVLGRQVCIRYPWVFSTVSSAVKWSIPSRSATQGFVL